MKNIYFRVFASILCLALLCGCTANNNEKQESAGNNMPGVDANIDSDTQADDTETVPDESADPSEDASDSESAGPGYPELTNEELVSWESYFNTMENNGLLRFPYSDLENDPEQLAPYLVWLFYDIGEMESEFSEEELALLGETDLWLELDAHRLSREYMSRYLYEHFNLPTENTTSLFDAVEFGIYLAEFDAWYIAHGDTEYRFYKFDRGVKFEDGTVKLYYFNDFLRIAQDNGETDYADAQMIVTLIQREDGTWYITSHEIDRSTWND